MWRTLVYIYIRTHLLSRTLSSLLLSSRTLSNFSTVWGFYLPRSLFNNSSTNPALPRATREFPKERGIARKKITLLFRTSLSLSRDSRTLTCTQLLIRATLAKLYIAPRRPELCWSSMHIPRKKVHACNKQKKKSTLNYLYQTFFWCDCWLN